MTIPCGQLSSVQIYYCINQQFPSTDREMKHIFTVRNVVAARLCFYGHLSFCSRGGGVSQHALGRHPPGPTPSPVQCMLRYTHPPAQCMLGYTPPRRPLQRTVRILLECILVVYSVHFTAPKVKRFCGTVSIISFLEDT